MLVGVGYLKTYFETLLEVAIFNHFVLSASCAVGQSGYMVKKSLFDFTLNDIELQFVGNSYLLHLVVLEA